VQTMHPTIAAGIYSPNADLLSAPEFEARLQRLQAVMAAQDWAGMIVYGDSLQSSLLMYISNYAPRIRWSMALVPRLGNDIKLLLGVAARDLKFAAELTCAADPTTYDKLPQILPDWLACLAKSVPPSDRRLGLAGRQNITRERFAAVAELCRGWALEDADSAVTPLWRIHSPAEGKAVADASRLLQAVAVAFIAHRRRGLGPRAAAIRAEKDGYHSGAHDIRFLLSTELDGLFAPVQFGMPESAGGCSAYLAVRNAGYWVDAIIEDGRSAQLQQRAATALQAIIRCVRPQGRRDHLAGALHAATAGCVLHPAPHLISHVGLELAEFSASDTFAAGTAVSVQFGLKWHSAAADSGYAFASAVVVPTEHAPIVLFDSSELVTSVCRSAARGSAFDRRQN
jgi:hypothetical protein